MRVVKWILAVVVVLAAVFVVGGMLLPRNVEVARSVEIDAPAEQVFPHVNSLKATQAWSPWLERDPDVKLTFEGPDTGVGSKMAWTSEEPTVGAGTQEITESVENKSVKTALDFGDMGTAVATFDLAAAGGKTTLTWGLNSDMGAGPVGRWMGLMMDSWVGGDYEKGLANLKTLVESEDNSDG
ncbi:MAG: SRPBCC family protein [Paracoccaceae bacterium]